MPTVSTHPIARRIMTHRGTSNMRIALVCHTITSSANEHGIWYMKHTCTTMGVVRLSRRHFRRGQTGDLDGVNGQNTVMHTEAGIWSVNLENRKCEWEHTLCTSTSTTSASYGHHRSRGICGNIMVSKNISRRGKKYIPSACVSLKVALTSDVGGAQNIRGQHVPISEQVRWTRRERHVGARAK